MNPVVKKPPAVRKNRRWKLFKTLTKLDRQESLKNPVVLYLILFY